MNYIMVVEKVDFEDWVILLINELVKCVFNFIYKGEGNIIFFYDVGGNCIYIVEVFLIIIKDLKKYGYSFVIILDLMNKE